MKQLLFPLLFLPCLALAQYPGNANQKITLGEQTTADGLVYRGLASADTIRKPSIDTMAYMVLDTTTNLLWHYKKGASNAWLQAGGGTAVTSITAGTGLTGGTITSTGTLAADTNFLVTRFDTSSMLTNYWRAGRFAGTLPVANGGTGSATQNFVDLTTTQTSIGGAKTFTSALTGTSATFTGTGSFKSLNSAADVFTIKYSSAEVSMLQLYELSGGTDVEFNLRNSSGTAINRLSTNGDSFITSGNVGIGTTGPSEKLHVAGSARITGAYDNTDAGAANVFVTTTGVLKRSTSSIKYKTEVEDYSKGLSDVLKLRPVTYKSINLNDNKIYAGFIAEELSDLKLSELLQNNEEGEPDAISYAYIVALLTKAIQEQQQQIEGLKKRLLTLENK